MRRVLASCPSQYTRLSAHPRRFGAGRHVRAHMRTCVPTARAALQAAKQQKKRDLQKRGSSGNWIADRVTWQEEIAYKRAMGYL